MHALAVSLPLDVSSNWTVRELWSMTNSEDHGILETVEGNMKPCGRGSSGRRSL